VATLRITSGPRAGETVEVDKQELVIGREGADVEVEDVEMSRRHAILRRAARRLEIEDLGSKNGTFVNGSRIEEPTPLGGGTEIRIGTTVMVVEGALPVSTTGEAPGRLDPAVTRVSETPPEMRQPAPAAPTALAQPAAQAPAGPMGEFHPPERRGQRGLASRSWVPVALSFGTVLVTAVLLVLYFALRATP
jgi:pSer/pThr/pTyr-binding forkhead associated (FHA) protein